MIIEDNAANLALVDFLLTMGGYRTVSARDGAEGVRLAQEERPGLILCDLQMPVLNGYEVLQELRGDPATRAIPVVAVTAFSMPGDRIKVTQAGFDGYISKPIEPEQFVREIETYLPPGQRATRSSG
jgi:two-component system cell cycle response regulator DivK